MDIEPEKPDFRVIEYPFHLGDLTGGTTNLDDSQFGAYMRILIANINAQATKGGLPDNEEVLRSYTRMGPAAWKKLWLLIGDKFVRENGKIYHKRVKETVNEIIKASNAARANRMKRKDSPSTGVLPGLDDGSTNPKTLKPLNHKPRERNSDSVGNIRAEESGSGFSVSENGKGEAGLPARRFDIEFFLDDRERAECKALAPQWDFQNLMREYNQWIATKGIPDKPVPAFKGWLKKKTKGKPPL